MAPAPKATLAIDFGTSNTVVAVWDPAQAVPRLLTLPGLSRPDHSAIPSLVYVKGKGQLLVGETVRAGRWGQWIRNGCFRGLSGTWWRSLSLRREF